MTAWTVVTAVLAPTTTLTAALFYFGWVRASTTFSYFGVDVQRTVGYSTTDYLLRSSTVVFTPLVILGLATAAALVGFRTADSYLSMTSSADLNRITSAVAGIALVSLGAAAVVTLEPAWVSRAPLVKPAALGIGVLLFSWSGHLRRRLSTQTLDDSRATESLVLRGALGALLVLAVFWATSILASEQGLRVAHNIERTLPEQTGVVVYAKELLYITGAGVNFVTLNDSPTGFHFRYTGLRLLARTSAGGYLLLPRGWTRTSGSPVYVLEPSLDIRVDLQSLPAD